VPHRARPVFKRATPVHLTIRVAGHVWNLRSRRSFRAVGPAIYAAADRFDVRIIQFSILGNHIHLLVEAADHVALARATKGLLVRIAKRLNRMMGRSGRVLGDRYYARLLRTPTEVRRVISYIRDNMRQHARAWGEHRPACWVDPYSSETPSAFGHALPAPTSWLLRVGWQRGSP
jgi:REP element-mobilizing transposase RayT